MIIGTICPREGIVLELCCLYALVLFLCQYTSYYDVDRRQYTLFWYLITRLSV